MSRVDDELTRRFHLAERPVGSGDLFEGLARRRRRRRTLQRLQAGALAVVVLVGTGAGFLALRTAFEEGERDIGDPVELPANGEIVLSRPLPDGSEHLFSIRPRALGERRITSGGAVYREPSVSPDGRAIVVVHSIPSFADMNVAGVIAIVSMDGGPPEWVTEPGIVHAPDWSPDGEEILFDGEVPGSSDGIHVLDLETRQLRLVIRSSGAFMVDDPAWSPDGSRIVFAGYDHDAGEQPDLYSIAPDGSGLERLTRTPDIAERSPDWSPDGSAIVYIASDPVNASDTIRLITPDGDATDTLFGVEGSVLAEVGWSPDGRYLVFLSDLALHDGDQDGDLDVWTVRSTGDEGTLVNYTDEGVSGVSWQPLPATAPVPPPSASPTHEPEGRDVGLGFNLCHAERLGRIDLTGSGANGQAWVGVPTRDDGSCPKRAGSDAYVVAADADGDGRAEASSDLPWECSVDCVPYAAVDLDGNGTEELIVASYFSIMDYYVVRYLGPPEEPSPVIAPVLVAEPGHEPAGLIAGEPLRIDAGGDAGYSSEIVCDPPVITWTWTFAPIDSQEPTEVHQVEIELRDDGAFHVVGRNDFTVPAGQPPGATDHTAPSCGVDWHPAP